MVQSAPRVVSGSELAWLTYTQLMRKAEMLAAKQVTGCWSEFSIVRTQTTGQCSGVCLNTRPAHGCIFTSSRLS